MKATMIMKPYLQCPCGNHEFAVSHLMEWPPKRYAGPWYCDACGVGWMVTRTESGFDLEERKGEGERKTDRSVLLRIPPQKESIWLLVKGMRFGEKEDGSDRYYYEEHTCPTNYLRQTAEIMIGDYTDPHGIAEFVDARDGDPFEAHCDNSRTEALIREMVGAAKGRAG